MTATIDHQVVIKHERDIEAFALCIRDAVVSRITLSEKFSGIRLSNTRLTVRDSMHMLGLAHASGAIEVRQATNALQLAATVIHEMAHILVGVAAHHNADFFEACNALGFFPKSHEGESYTTSHFDPAMLDAIEQAIRRFALDNPGMVYDPNIEIPWPAGVRDMIMPFQNDEVRDMLGRAGNILLASEMGLGKTAVVMGYINVTHPTRILVICPNNIKYVWLRHFQTFCIHPYDVEVAATQLYTFGDVVIMNYEAALKWGEALARADWDLVVFDEMHYLKTPSAKRSQACYKIKGAKAIGVTASPIVNYPYEIFPILHYLDRPRWPEYGTFEARHGSKSSNKLGRNLNRLNAELRASVMVRHTKREVLTQLPKKRRQVVEFEVSPEIRKLIDEEKALFASTKDSPELAHFIQVMMAESRTDTSVAVDEDIDFAALIEAMQQTRKFAFSEIARIAHKIARAKLPFVIEHIEQMLEAREKVMVFGHHRDVLEAIADKFAPHAALLLGGQTDQAGATMKATERFANDDTCTLFVSGIHLAQGYSLQGSSTVLFVEEDWVPGLMTQAENRGHGLGRGEADAKSMLIQHLVFEDSLDTYKAQLTIKKQRSIDRAMA